MNNELRVLVIEDSEDDTLLLLRELQAAGYAPEYLRVQTPAGVMAALEQRPWDVVVCDHAMPGFDSLQALEIFRQSGQDIPFIVVSWTMGEDLAVKVLKAGANDYVMKDKLARVALSIDRELRESASRRARIAAEAALQRSQRELEDFFEHAPVGLRWEGPDGTILRVNRAELQMLGWSREEYLGHNIAEFYVEPGLADEIFRRLGAGDTITNQSAQLRCKDGSVKHVLFNANALVVDGRFVHTRCFTRDVTEIRRVEEERINLIEELTYALANVKTLRGLLPICASCKKIRDDGGYWKKVESYLSEHTQAEFTHGLCPDCLETLYPGTKADK